MERLMERSGRKNEACVKANACATCLMVCMNTDSCEKCSIQEVFEKLCEYEDLEEQGLLVRLPCKVGDTLYWISDEDENGNKVLTIMETEPVKAVAVSTDGIYVRTEEEPEYDKLGSKYALLTREEAEDALQKMVEGGREL